VIRKEVNSKNQVGPEHSSSNLSINNMRLNEKLLTLSPIIAQIGAFNQTDELHLFVAAHSLIPPP
jgi:hypothetical protein